MTEYNEQLKTKDAEKKHQLPNIFIFLISFCKQSQKQQKNFLFGRVHWLYVLVFDIFFDKETLISWLRLHYISDKEKQEKASTYIHTYMRFT